MNPLRITLFLTGLVFVLGCSKPSTDEMEENIIGKWTIEYYDEYARDNWDDNEDHNGELTVHNELVGHIEFLSDHTGILTDSSYSQTFSWSINDKDFLIFDFPANASNNDAHPIAYRFYNSGFCDPEVTAYSILRSEPTTHVFRYRVGGSCSHESFHCLEWAITK